MQRKHSLWTPVLLGLSVVVIGSVALGGRLAANAATKANKSAARHDPLTFTHDIAPILFQNCASCHRPGEIGPFPLLTYEDAQKRARQIAEVTANHTMPPWHANSHGEFANERKLTTEQIAVLRQWANDGAPEGNPAELPPLPAFPADGWALGQPDTTLQLNQPYQLAAEGPDVYRYFTLPTHFTTDRYLSGIEFHPGNSRVVHHIIAFVDTSGQARKLEAAAHSSGYSNGLGFVPAGILGGWAPGNLPRLEPDGIGIFVPKGADIVLQIHYHKDGKPETDQSQLGLYFAKKPIDKRLRVLPIIGLLDIPPGNAHYNVDGIPMLQLHDITVHEVLPHMHLLGKTMTIGARLPDGTIKTLVSVPNYDFNWQTTYVFKQPVKLPRWSFVGLKASYDNSANNPNNPYNPPRHVTWGEETTDEMCLGVVWYTYDDEHLTRGHPVKDLADYAVDIDHALRNAFQK
jgi:mono/diheme cytochrome c family protein